MEPGQSGRVRDVDSFLDDPTVTEALAKWNPVGNVARGVGGAVDGSY